MYLFIIFIFQYMFKNWFEIFVLSSKHAKKGRLREWHLLLLPVRYLNILSFSCINAQFLILLVIALYAILLAFQNRTLLCPNKLNSSHSHQSSTCSTVSIIAVYVIDWSTVIGKLDARSLSTPPIMWRHNHLDWEKDS